MLHMSRKIWFNVDCTGKNMRHIDYKWNKKFITTCYMYATSEGIVGAFVVLTVSLNARDKVVQHMS